MIKKLLTIAGILLLLGAAAWGGIIFLDRHKNKQLITTTSDQKTVSSTPKDIPTFDKKKYSLTDPTSIWVIVNKNRPLSPLTYAPSDLVDSDNGQQLRKEAADALARLFAGAKAKNYTLAGLSGYRSYTKQQAVYSKEVATNGQSVADTESAKPGYSEHQTGLAIDIGGGGCGIENCFGKTAEGEWVATHAYEYGYIIRYPEGKQAITGYRYEPWHIRYIGIELAKELHDTSTLTLEEFFNVR